MRGGPRRRSRRGGVARGANGDGRVGEPARWAHDEGEVFAGRLSLGMRDGAQGGGVEADESAGGASVRAAAGGRAERTW